MADEIDIASERYEAWLENRLAEHSYQLGHAVSAYEQGRCRNCNETIDDGRAFCDKDCRIDFEDRQKALARRGRA